MGVNFILGGAINDKNYVLNDAVQENRFLLEFPYTDDGILIGNPIIATSDRVTPVTSKYSESKSGSLIPGFAVDWYERIHVSPISVNVGNLLSEQLIDVTVWNAYFSSKTLSQIYENADAGITLIQPKPLPVVFTPLEVLVYQLQVGVNGPPVVTGEYIFDFSFVQITLTAGGQRIVVVPFRPLQDCNESLEWKTNVIRAKAKEQRIALRDAPRQSIEYEYMFEDRQVSLSRAIYYGWANRQFGVPVWFEMEFVGSIAAGTTILTVDTSNVEYRVNYPAMIWVNDEEFEVLIVTAVNVGSIEFFVGPVNTYDNAYICPVRYGRAPSGISYKRSSNHLIKARTTFDIDRNADIGSSISLPTHSGLDVLTDVMYDFGAGDERVERNVTVIDNGLGIPVSDANYTLTDQTFSLGFVCFDRDELIRVRKWLHARKGKAKAFWLPTKTNDLIPISNISAGALAIDVRSIKYSLYYTTRAIQIVLNNGNRYFFNVLGGVTIGDVDTLSLQSAIPVSMNIQDIDYINFMYKVRLDTDRVEVKHGEAGYVTIRIPVREVPA